MLTLGPRPRHLPVLPMLLLVATALVLGAFYRTPQLDQRILHTDEAVHMVKLGQLMDDGEFIYDPHDFHGPTMYMATMIWGRFSGWSDSSDITISGVRVVIVVFGLLVVVSPLLFLHALGRGPAAIATLLLAASPAFVYYSRYYIMEMLLVAFASVALFCGWRWYLGRNRFWLIALGVSLGLMHATKETFVFNIAGAVGAASCMWMFRPRGAGLRLGDYRRKKHPIPWWDLATLGVAFLLTSALLMSNFLKHPQAIWDSYRTYLLYFDRAGGSGHEKPWYFYLKTLGWTRAGVLWTELFVLALGAVGAVSLWARRGTLERPVEFGRFISLYTLFQFILYAIIPYKTPWTILSSYHGVVLLAGVGVGALYHLSSHKVWRLLVVGMLVSGLWHLCLQSKRANDRFAADSRNPYVYSHTNPLLMRLIDMLGELQALMPEGQHLRVHVFERDHGWPLPWYLRDMPKVGYHNSPRSGLEADVFIVESRWREQMLAELGDDFARGGFHVLRPAHTLDILVREPLWQALLESRGVRPAAHAPEVETPTPDPEGPPSPSQSPVPPLWQLPPLLPMPPDPNAVSPTGQPRFRVVPPEPSWSPSEVPTLRALPADASAPVDL